MKYYIFNLVSIIFFLVISLFLSSFDLLHSMLLLLCLLYAATDALRQYVKSLERKIEDYED